MAYFAHQDVYAPCACGSGKKYKFCCLPRHRAERQKVRANQWPFSRAGLKDSGLLDLVLGPEGPEGGLDEFVETVARLERIHEQGLESLGKGDHRAAARCFEQLVKATPRATQAHNNLALARFQAGDVEDAATISEHVLRNLDKENVFALGGLIHYYGLLGREAEAREARDQLLRAIPADEYAAVKKCEALARFGDHEAVLATALESLPGADDPGTLHYFAGVALANLSRLEEAQAHLEAARSNPMYEERSRRYLRLLRSKEAPQTLQGGWPYLGSSSLLSIELVRQLESADGRARLPGAADALLSMLDDNPRCARQLIPLLSSFKSLRATDALRGIAFGTFGGDEARQAAYLELLKLGAIEPGKTCRLWLRGDWQEIRGMIQEVSPEAASELPPAVVEGTRQMLLASEAGDYARAEQIGRDLLRQAPYSPAVRQNLSTTFAAQGRFDEEEALLEEAIALDPSYLFAPATLAVRRLEQGRLEEARAILRGVVFPQRVHPLAQGAFLRSQALVEVVAGNLESASAHLRMLRQVSPEKIESDSQLLALEKTIGKLTASFERTHKRWVASEAKLRRRIVPRGAGLEVCLRGYATARLGEIAAALGIEGAEGPGKRRLLASICKRLLEPGAVRSIVAGLPEKAQAALSALVEAGGVLGHVDFTRLHGGDGWEGLRLDSRPREAEESALGSLKAWALAFERTVENEESVIAPLEVLEAMKSP